jgi:murein DD-endopeptidase MepM/ murein hydrolase activator NlpD
VVGSKSGIRSGSAGKVLTVAIALLAGLGGTASAVTTGGAPTPASVPLPPSPVGTPAPGTPSSGTLSIVSATTSPRKSFFYGFRYPSLRFAIGSTQQQNDLRIEVVNSAGEAMKTYYRNDVAPETTTSIRWDGTNGEGKPAPNGHYSFRIGAQGATASVARPAPAAAPLSLGFDLYGYAFPVLGPHNFGDAADRFGAPRDGHTHQGQDTMAACGTPLVAARGGKVQYSGFEGNAGNYIVIDGKGTPLDFMYAHLAQPSPLKTGATVRTGQPIGVVGDTGDATACHLHFEIWTAPGWYQGGHPIDPLPYLKQWDVYS